MKENKRLLLSLRQQLINELIFVRKVSKIYRDAPNDLDIVDFKYRGTACKLILNGKLSLKTKRGTSHIESFNDLVHGLIQSNYSRERVA